MSEQTVWILVEVEENQKDVQTQPCICTDKRATKVKSLHVSPSESWCVGTLPVTAMCTLS